MPQESCKTAVTVVTVYDGTQARLVSYTHLRCLKAFLRRRAQLALDYNQEQKALSLLVPCLVLVVSSCIQPPLPDEDVCAPIVYFVYFMDQNGPRRMLGIHVVGRKLLWAFVLKQSA